MADAKKILVVDDHFEMLEFLRSMLELSNQDCEVLAVPSAEEGLLEARRTQFDLIISDVRLPGMSGFDFIRRIRKLGQETPVIMITAYSSEQGRSEADSLGVMRYFSKPLDTDDVLTAVHHALYGENGRSKTLEPDTSAPLELSSNVKKRLDTLRTDTGAIQVLLATKDGEIEYVTGTDRLDLPPLAKIVARNINDSFLLAQLLGTKEPFSLQYHAGDAIELYCANVGEYHFVTLFFDAQARRGRIGTVWVFTQRAISDLQIMLTIETPVKTDNVAVIVEPTEEVRVPLPKQPAQLSQLVQPMAGKRNSAPAEVPPPPPEPIPKLQLDPIEATADDLMALLSEDVIDDSALDLDAFWSEAVTDDEPSDLVSGLSIEEAQEKGLFVSDLDEDESTTG